MESNFYLVLFGWLFSNLIIALLLALNSKRKAKAAFAYSQVSNVISLFLAAFIWNEVASDYLTADVGVLILFTSAVALFFVEAFGFWLVGKERRRTGRKR